MLNEPQTMLLAITTTRDENNPDYWVNLVALRVLKTKGIVIRVGDKIDEDDMLDSRNAFTDPVKLERAPNHPEFYYGDG